jgi:hypothetical protein
MRKQMECKLNHLLFIASDGWPVEYIINHPIKSWIRRIILTKKIITYKTWLKDGGCKINQEKREFQIGKYLYW